MSVAADKVGIVWFRRDLRLNDNPALTAALDGCAQVVPLFINDPQAEYPWEIGGASKWWLHHSLLELRDNLSRFGSRLILRSGSSRKELLRLIEETGASAVYWNRLYEPAVIKRDSEIKTHLRRQKIEVCSFKSALLVEPWELLNQSNKPYQVFGAFYRAVQKMLPESAGSSVSKISAFKFQIDSLDLKDFALLPTRDWAAAFSELWRPGEKGGQLALSQLPKEIVGEYSENRDRPDRPGTSRLSPHLHFGEISPNQILEILRQAAPANDVLQKPFEAYFRQIIWREFAHSLLYHFPHTDSDPLRPEFRKFPWKRPSRQLRAWKKGVTGFPIVDAGMRELWTTGWMHNRVRMIVASFLVKDLMIKWQEGAKWFWDTLLDADLANNSMGWQWVAGCGADAAPYFRVFNPVLQGEKFDPDGKYVRRWVPELEALPKKWIHRPWEAPPAVLASLNFKLGRDYPAPIVDHAEARELALEAFESIKNR